MIYILVILLFLHHCDAYSQSVNPSSSSFPLYAKGFGSSNQVKSDTDSINDNEKCHCCSQKLYVDCCKPFHKKTSYPDNPTALVRTRFSAFSYGVPEYIIDTTHPEHPEYSEGKKERKEWRKSIQEFSNAYSFKGLTFINASPHDANTATVKFEVYLVGKFSGTARKQKSLRNVETSTFGKVGGKWLYQSGLLHSTQ